MSFSEFENRSVDELELITFGDGITSEDRVRAASCLIEKVASPAEKVTYVQKFLKSGFPELASLGIGWCHQQWMEDRLGRKMLWDFVRTNKDSELARYALCVLADFGDVSVVNYCIEMVDKNIDDVSDCCRVLGNLGTETALATLRSWLNKFSEHEYRFWIALQLARNGDGVVQEYLLRRIDSRELSDEEELIANVALSNIGNESALNKTQLALTNEENHFPIQYLCQRLGDLTIEGGSDALQQVNNWIAAKRHAAE